MSSAKKTITVNRADLAVNKTRKRQAAKKVVSPIKLKEKFVKKVRAMQSKSLPTRKTDESSSTTSPRTSSNSSFKDAIGFLNELDKHKSACLTPAEKSPITPTLSVTPTSNQSRVIIKPEPPFSSLKNSGKPTYREWRAMTMKRPCKPRQKVRLDAFHDGGTDAHVKMPVARPMRTVPNRKRTVKLGKSKGRVTLMVYGQSRTKSPNSTKDPYVMKKHLRSKNLIKTGSSAPNSIVRAIYSGSKQAGDITNQSNDVALHNFNQ